MSPGRSVWSLVEVGFTFALALLALSADAAATTPAAPPARAPLFSKKPRHAVARTVLPEAIQVLLPAQGIYAAGSGSSAASWRVIVTGEGELRAGSNARPGSSATELVDQKHRKLTPELLRELCALGDRAWREKRAKAGPPMDDYDEILIVADGADVYRLAGEGAITGGAAEALLQRLKAEAAK